MPTPEPEAASIRRESAWARLVERRWEALVVARRAAARSRAGGGRGARRLRGGGGDCGWARSPAWLDAWLAARVDRACDVRRNRAARCAGRVVPLEAGDAANPNDRGGFARHPNFQHANDPKTNDGAGAGSILGADDVGAFVRAELARLDAPVRAAMERRWLVGRSVREVARELGVSEVGGRGTPGARDARDARAPRGPRAGDGAMNPNNVKCGEMKAWFDALAENRPGDAGAAGARVALDRVRGLLRRGRVAARRGAPAAARGRGGKGGRGAAAGA